MYPHAEEWAENRVSGSRNVIICSALFFVMFVAGLVMNICFHICPEKGQEQRTKVREIALKEKETGNYTAVAFNSRR